jgi:hypothetical protein
VRLAQTVIDCNIFNLYFFPVEPIKKDFQKTRKKVVLNCLLRRTVDFSNPASQNRASIAEQCSISQNCMWWMSAHEFTVHDIDLLSFLCRVKQILFRASKDSFFTFVIPP